MHLILSIHCCGGIEAARGVSYGIGMAHHISSRRSWYRWYSTVLYCIAAVALMMMMLVLSFSRSFVPLSLPCMK